MSIGLLESTGLRRSIPLVMCPTAFSCVLSCTRLLMSCDLDASPVLTFSEFSVAGVLCCKNEILISLSLARLTAFFSVMHLIPEHTVCCLLILTSSERLVKSLSTRLHRAMLLSLKLQEMMSSGPPSLKMRRKKLRRVMLRLPRVLWTKQPLPRARTLMTALTRLHPLPGGRSSRWLSLHQLHLGRH